MGALHFKYLFISQPLTCELPGLVSYSMHPQFTRNAHAIHKKCLHCLRSQAHYPLYIETNIEKKPWAFSSRPRAL